MANRMTVDDLLKEKNLTAEEMELFKDLIQETKDRETRIHESTLAARESLARLSETLSTISERTTLLSTMLASVVEQTEMLYLRLMPDHKFYKE